MKKTHHRLNPVNCSAVTMLAAGLCSHTVNGRKPEQKESHMKKATRQPFFGQDENACGFVRSAFDQI